MVVHELVIQRKSAVRTQTSTLRPFMPSAIYAPSSVFQSDRLLHSKLSCDCNGNFSPNPVCPVFRAESAGCCADGAFVPDSNSRLQFWGVILFRRLKTNNHAAGYE